MLKEKLVSILEDASDNWDEEHLVAEIQVERLIAALLILYDSINKTKANMNFTENLIVFLLLLIEFSCFDHKCTNKTHSFIVIHII
ncbi:hypothetical protein KGMB02408_41720 [Bacteroides faecalis]|uniref:Uncharacterized protein n=1 Tax=Bacteroides faecalis TaxID=2447885 RepID=A0A401M0H4_9BACE|nr:hypothetical protein KGMB02408_41720 [Bacteroides faecalis]